MLITLLHNYDHVLFQFTFHNFFPPTNKLAVEWVFFSISFEYLALFYVFFLYSNLFKFILIVLNFLFVQMLIGETKMSFSI